MIKKSLNWNIDYNKKNEPMLLKPAAKDYLWGGKRLNSEYAKNIGLNPLAETWECSTHPDGRSIVVSGKFDGEFLSDVIREHTEYLGKKNEGLIELPVLVKFIDANKDLSIQVHPNDSYAFLNENGQRGKTEMWYVLDATKNAQLIYGLVQDVSKEQLKKALIAGTAEKYMQRISVKKDEVFYIEAGTIHAIGAGCLIAEIQENSNLTYRLYDYNRKDKMGNKRPLHIEKGLDVANLKSSSEPKQPLRVLRYKQGIASELLSRCKYFEVYRVIVNTERRQKVYYQSDELGFRILLCINGCGVITFNEEGYELYKGDCIFVPANSVKIKIHGKIQFLDIRG